MIVLPFEAFARGQPLGAVVGGVLYRRGMDLSARSSTEWAAFGQVGALIVAVAAGVLVWLQVRQGRHIREDQTRPYVIVDFEFRASFVAIAIDNIGTTAARDVEFRFDPPLKTPAGNDLKIAIFSDGVPMIAPGRRILIPYGSGTSLFSDDNTAPLRYKVRLHYTDLTGKRRYDDPVLVLDLGPYKHSMIGRDDLHQIYQNLKAIKQLMTSWTKERRLGVNVQTQAEVDQRDEEWYEERRDQEWDLLRSQPRDEPDKALHPATTEPP
jgi:hypothetical protein